MQPELKFKLIQNLNKKKLHQGFTLIELLVVVIIIGILSAVALPSYLNQTVKARQAEAKNTVGAVNSSQSAFRVVNPSFANNMDELGLGMPTDTAVYTYGVTGTNIFAKIAAEAKDSALKSYSGATELYADNLSQSIISSVVCETATPGMSTSVPVPGAPPSCPPGMLAVGR